jgi:hypothetical protein
MSETNRVKTRVISKHDYEVNWLNSEFVPEKGEIIVYDAEADESGNFYPGATLPDNRKIPYTVARVKTGDGATSAKDLKFDSSVINGEADGSIKTTMENVVGCRAFLIKGVAPWGFENSIDGKMTLTLSSVNGLEAGDICSLRLGGNAIDFGKIERVDTDNNTVTIDKYLSWLTKSYLDRKTANGTNFTISHQFWITTKQVNIDSGESYGDHITESYQTAEGQYTSALGYAAHAEGYGSIASGRYSHAEGTNTISGYAAHAEGSATKATANYSHAEGNTTVATGEDAHSEGLETHATGTASHAEGYKTTASNNYAHAEGLENQATGNSSHAEGAHSVASGTCSHVEGDNSESLGYCSHSGGVGSVAAGESSFAHGHACKTHADNSTAIGYRVEAVEEKQTVLGRFNSKVDGLLLVGIGESDSSLKNGMRLDDSGNLFIKGDVYYGCTDDCTSIGDGHSVDDLFQMMDHIQTEGVSRADTCGRAASAGEADSAKTAEHADLANHATQADYAVFATDAGVASRATYAETTGNVEHATYADTANYANTAGEASEAITARSVREYTVAPQLPANSLVVFNSNDCYDEPKGVYKQQYIEYDTAQGGVVTRGYLPLLLNTNGCISYSDSDDNTKCTSALSDVYLLNKNKFVESTMLYTDPPVEPEGPSEPTNSFTGALLSDILKENYATKTYVEQLIIGAITDTYNVTTGGQD